MSFLLFLRGFIGVLVVFAIANYLVTQSFWTTFLHTLICAVLLQIGYFAAVLFLVWRSAGQQNGEETAAKSDTLPKEDHPTRQVVRRLPGVPRSPLP
jgi:exopolysaccharide production repressor protein